MPINIAEVKWDEDPIDVGAVAWEQGGEIPVREDESPFLIGAGRGITETGQGLKQLGMKIGEVAGLVEPEEVEAYRQQINRDRELYERSIGSQRSVAGEIVGKIAAGAPAMLIPGGAAASLATRTLSGVGAGALSAGAEPVYEEDFAAGKLGQLTEGALFGGGSVIGLDKIRDLLPKNIVARLAKTASEKDFAKEGQLLSEIIPGMTPAQITGSRSLSLLENAARQSIFTADQVAKQDKIVAGKAFRAITNFADTISKKTKGSETIGNDLRDATTRAVTDLSDMRRVQANLDYGAANDVSMGAAVIEPSNYVDELRSIVREYSGSEAADARKVAAQARQILNRSFEKAKKVSKKEQARLASSQALMGKPRAIEALDTIKMKTVNNAVSDRSFYGAASAGTGNVFKDISPNLDRRIAGRLHGALTRDLIENEANPKIGQLLKNANDNYAANSKSIKSIEKSALGRLVGEGVEDAANIFGTGSFNTVAGETLAKKMLRLEPSEARTAMKIIGKSNPHAVQDFKAFVLRDALDNAIPPVSSGADTFPFSSTKFVSNMRKIGEGRLKAYQFTPKEIKDINNLTKGLERIGDRSGYNWSGTAPMNQVYEVAKGLATGGTTAISTLISAIGLKRIADAMADPEGIKAISTIIKPFKGQTSIDKAIRTIERLSIAAISKELAE